MPADLVPDIMACLGTPCPGPGALGTWQLQAYSDSGGPGNQGAPVEANHTAKGRM
jgi:hypothetical protein